MRRSSRATGGMDRDGDSGSNSFCNELLVESGDESDVDVL